MRISRAIDGCLSCVGAGSFSQPKKHRVLLPSEVESARHILAIRMPPFSHDEQRRDLDPASRTPKSHETIFHLVTCLPKSSANLIQLESDPYTFSPIDPCHLWASLSRRRRVPMLLASPRRGLRGS